MAQMLPLLLLSMLTLIPSASLTTPIAIRTTLTHIDSKYKLTKAELLRRAGHRSKTRVAVLSAKLTTSATTINVPIHYSHGAYLMDMAIGTPALSFSGIADTGSDLIWLQCAPCRKCFHQPTPLYDPSRSSTSKKIPCSSDLCMALPQFSCAPDCEYYYSYVDESSTRGYLASETFTMGFPEAVSVSGMAFGCGNLNQGDAANGTGVIGMGLGPLSLIAQLGVGKFSYCLTRLSSPNSSPLLLGALAVINGTSETIVSTPLLRNPLHPTFYYISLIGITVGAIRLPIPPGTFKVHSDGSGGCIIDSGTTYTFLEMTAYSLLREEFVRQVNLPVVDTSDFSLDLCFQLTGSSPAVPKLVFHFEGADLDLPASNYLVVMTVDSSTKLLCLTVNGNSGFTVFGNWQQRNMQIVYDLEHALLSFAPAECDKL